jgi:Chaperone of endosialidase
VADCVKNAAGTQIAGTCPSDERLKTNIEPFSPLLSRLVQLQPVHFDWRVVEYPDYHFGSERSYGLIAQQVEQVFPELVSRDKNGFKAVNYSELPLLLLQVVRELNAENKSMQEQRDLEMQQNRKLESRVAALEAVLAAEER